MARTLFRRKRLTPVLAAVTLLIGVLTAAPAQAAPADRAKGAMIEVYTAELTPEQVKLLDRAGLAHEELEIRKVDDGRVRVEAILSRAQATALNEQGLGLKVKKVDGEDTRMRAKAAAETVFRPYSGPGNLRAELLEVASENPSIATTVEIGKSLSGKPITAVRVSKDVENLKDGQRPAVVYQAAQHAREWITPEMVRRLLHHYVDGYGTDPELTEIVDTTDLWFIPVINVDGYDLTFQDGFRLWRKNLRDNNGDGRITGQDGVDLNRNFPHRWGYDNEGSSPNPTSGTYRGASPGSEPETQVQMALFERIKPKYLVNYHSAAELLLYGNGWQTLTPSPDDVIYKALLGDTENPAVPGYVPQLSAQLYTTNGDTNDHTDNVYGTLSYTPEMATCATAAGYDPDDAWEPENCGSGFEFPDDEALVELEFQNNLPLAIATAQSAQDPDRPASPVGLTTPDFQVDEFDVSYGSEQEVASIVRRSLRNRDLLYRINGGPVRQDGAREWRGGDRFGDGNDHYYGEFRGTVSGQSPGDEVEVWFAGTNEQGERVESEHFTYEVRDQRDADVLVIADEDYTGVNPTYPEGVDEPKYAGRYADLVREAGHTPLVWDIDADGAPHPLGVLNHFDAVVWYLGDNRLTQDPEDEPLWTAVGEYPDSQVADRAKDLQLNLRAYLNERGKLMHVGETTGYFGPLSGMNGGGIYYGLKGHPEEPCRITTSWRDDCELLSDDFFQYYLGAYNRQEIGSPAGFTGTWRPHWGIQADLSGTESNELNEAGAFQVTSSVLPVDDFPQFRSWKSGDYTGAAASTEPVEGHWYVAGTHQDATYRRLTRTIDLTNVTAEQVPALQAQLSYDTETGYDNVIVEAHTVGAGDWTTLPDENGGTGTTVPTQCEQEYLLDMHPFLEHYLTRGNPCGGTGSTGEWNAFTGDSDGWTPVEFDLSAYAGKKVEVSISYVSDPATGGIGLFVDDTKLTTSAGTIDAEGFESGLGPWTIQGAPEGSPGNISEFVRSEAVIDSSAAVVTKDTVLLGFGLEQIKSKARQEAMMEQSLKLLLP